MPVRFSCYWKYEYDCGILLEVQIGSIERNKYD